MVLSFTEDCGVAYTVGMANNREGLAATSCRGGDISSWWTKLLQLAASMRLYVCSVTGRVGRGMLMNAGGMTSAVDQLW